MQDLKKQPKACSFIGHRKIEKTEDIVQKLKMAIKDLINKHNVQNFLFGSRSEFDDMCYEIITELQIQYPHIKRILYTCKSESCVLETQREEMEKLYSQIEKREVHLFGFEEEREHQTKYSSGKASYVERNQAMIDDSDFCVFFYDENYQPPKRKHSKSSLTYYQPKSGTKLAYEYALRKKKDIINVKKFI